MLSCGLGGTLAAGGGRLFPPCLPGFFTSLPLLSLAPPPVSPGAGHSVLELLFQAPRCPAHRSPSECGAGLLLAAGERATPAERLGGGRPRPASSGLSSGSRGTAYGLLGAQVVERHPHHSGSSGSSAASSWPVTPGKPCPNAPGRRRHSNLWSCLESGFVRALTPARPPPPAPCAAEA